MQHGFLSVPWQTTVPMELTVAGEALHILLIKIYLLRVVLMTGRIALFFSLHFSNFSLYFFLCQPSKAFFF